MTPGDDVSRETSTPWQQYQDRSQAARAKYLVAVQAAYHEYLTGPYPDRSSYEAVERGAWFSYYAVCRDAWKTYATDLETTAAPRPAPPPESYPYPPSVPAVMWGDQHPPVRALTPPPGAVHESISGNPWPTERDVSPRPVLDESGLIVGSPFGGNGDINLVRASLEARFGLNCLECGIPWRQPSPDCPHREYDVHPRQPAFIPHPESER